MWDDHEIVNDHDAGRAGRYLPARTAFDDYVASHNPAPVRAGELYFVFRAADVDFFVLDTRSYRSPQAWPDDSAKTMLGANQKTDLENWLVGSGAQFKVVVSSVPFHHLGIRHRDAWSGYATERAEIFEFIRQRNIPGVVILSGDQHWSSLVRHDPLGIVEFTASPLAQEVRGRPPTNDPRLIFAYDASSAFGIVDVDTRGSGPRMTFSVVDVAGRLRDAVTVGPSAPQAAATPAGG
jgi:alkaline phosphatase D